MKKAEDVKIGDKIYEIDGAVFRERGTVVRIEVPNKNSFVYRFYFDNHSTWNCISANPGWWCSYDYNRHYIYVWDEIQQLQRIHGMIIDKHLNQLAGGLNNLFGGYLLNNEN